VRSIAIEYFADRAEARLAQMGDHAVQKLERMGGVAVHAVMGEREWTKQPAPNGALVIDGVALARSAEVSGSVAWIICRQTTQANRRE
jgi:hypothetical protein